MIKSQRSKRRKIKHELNYTSQSLFLNNVSKSEENLNSDPCNVSIDNGSPSHPSTSKDTVIELSAKTSTIITTLNTSFTPMNNENNSSKNAEIFSNEIKTYYVNSTSPEFPIKNFLVHWATKYNITHVALNGLLKGLKNHDCFNDLPVDSRTLLCTPKNICSNIRNVEPGIYYHFGLAAGIRRFIPKNVTDNIKVSIGIDGLPLSKSSNGQFWPILASMIVDSHLPKKVFPVGIYYGSEKPKDSNDFLFDFINETNKLIINGMVVNQLKISVSIHVFCCDAPAKSFILKIKGHSGFSSCTRCTIEGEHLNNRVCFPYSRLKPKERSHQAYLSKLDEDHHTSNQSLTRLIELPGFDSVKSFSLDYMHLVCLGVMKKLLFLWVRGPLNVRFRYKKICELSTSLLSLKPFISSDFVRNVRGIQDLSRWKATEFRLFLIYLGTIVLKNILRLDCYVHFMSLNISMLILLSPDRGHLLDYARQLLDYFVKQFEVLYGKHYVSHNIHGLLHISDDYELYGPLDNCSTFNFENYMKELKSLLRKHEKPLHQIINRNIEKHNNDTTGFDEEIKNLSINLNQNYDKPLLKQEHTNGPTMEIIAGLQYYVVCFNNIKIKIKSDKDSYILTKDQQIVKCLNIIEQKNGNIFIVGKHFKFKSAFFDDPIDSTILDIYTVKNIANKINYWPITSIKKKMMILNHNNGQLVAMPIIHTSN